MLLIWIMNWYVKVSHVTVFCARLQTIFIWADSHNRFALYLCTPLQPELEYVVVSAALNDFIARVVLDVVQFVLHEQVLRAHLVAAEQQPLWAATQKTLVMRSHRASSLSLLTSWEILLNSMHRVVLENKQRQFNNRQKHDFIIFMKFVFDGR